MAFIDRQRNILDFTLSSLLRRRWRNASLLIVYTAVVFMLASVTFFTHSIKREAALILKDSPEIVLQRVEAGRHALIPIAYIEKVEAVRGVSKVKPRRWGYYFDSSLGANYTLIVPDGDTIKQGEITIGQGIGRTRNIQIGDMMPLIAHDGLTIGLKVTGFLSAESELVTSDVMLLHGADWQRFTGIADGLATDLAITAINPLELRTIAEKVMKELPDTRPILRDEILRTYEAVFDWRGGVLIVIFAGALMAFVIFAWDRAAGLSAEEKKEIGILKAIGWETSDVLLMKTWEGAAVSLSAYLIGIVLAYLHVFFASGVVFAPVLKGWSVLYPEFRLIPSIDYYQLSVLFFLTVVPYTIATIVPSWRAATVDPDSVMRT